MTCSLEVTAQKTISVKPWVGNMRKQMPPMTRPSLIKARVLCFLGEREPGHRLGWGGAWIQPPRAPWLHHFARSGDARVKDQAGNVLLGHAWQLVGEDVLQAHQPQQHPPVGFGCQRVADDVELNDPTAFLQAGRLIPGSVGRQ